MSIENLARAAASDAHHRATETVDTVSGLDRLHRMRRTRNVASLVGAVVAVAVVVVGGGALVSHGTISTPVVPPATSASPGVSGDMCSDPAITCLTASRFRLAVTVPVTVDVPVNFSTDLSILSPGVVEGYRTDLSGTGVTVMENAFAARADGWTADPAAGSTAASMASWLSKRPFLTQATITPTTVDGRAAWLVRATLKPGATLHASKNGTPAGPTFGAGSATAAFAVNLTGTYVLLDVPGAGVTVIWSWTNNYGIEALADNQGFIDGLHFG